MNLYDILEVSPRASDEVIKNAYRALVKKYHPDLFTESDKSHAEERMKRINYAFEILTDKYKRAEYDRQFFKQDISNVYTKNQSSAEKHCNNDYNKQNTKVRKADTDTNVGSGKSDFNNNGIPAFFIAIVVFSIVLSIVFSNQNQQTINDSSNLHNNQPGKLEDDLISATERLNNIELVEPILEKTQKYFTLGSSKDEVKSIMGTPAAIANYSALGQEDWSYGISTVTFNNQGLVTEWNNVGNNLKVFLGEKENNVTFTIGSNKDDVLKAMGTPSGIANYSALGQEDWSYGISTVSFNKQGLVTEWNNIGRNLTAYLGDKVNGSSFTIGSNKADVLRAMGTPTGIANYSALGQEDWSYGISTVTFNNNGKVTEWNNIGNNLNLD